MDPSLHKLLSQTHPPSTLIQYHFLEEIVRVVTIATVTIAIAIHELLDLLPPFGDIPLVRFSGLSDESGSVLSIVALVQVLERTGTNNLNQRAPIS
jgi:hypothetical protein